MIIHIQIDTLNPATIDEALTYLDTLRAVKQTPVNNTTLSPREIVALQAEIVDKVRKISQISKDKTAEIVNKYKTAYGTGEVSKFPAGELRSILEELEEYLDN